jgi:malate synthase
VHAGHDGTWVAHPSLVPLAREIFDAHMKGPNQIYRRPQMRIDLDLLHVPGGDITEAGLRWNIDVGLQYLESWLRGSGCVPIYHLMEDAATAEICRTQVWQWVKHGARMNDGRVVTAEFVRRIMLETVERLSGRLEGHTLKRAAQIFEQMMTSEEFPEFLTLAAYQHID